ncbi:H+transporting two-sector ATPase B/B' subunit [Geobacter metallireducens RCH3]|uniref:ATP synthase subunit b n=1 Tax=Geobacter metallireducens (strain ATCC 53774 / DSM 7210 / GS-15) TaxID=269799 RepID=ATPF_GEOMG|nr:ATP synthase F0 subunit B [Geobacter metallireducens]Q39Q52.1 RecName: Full=ATP synthase subunit b; AltName: Full=ATP synthase F(0) sector subunit b; AltName: Full=ATPase subunit I; AltName: Full=F-type ATPase subunit b; Short=F-ATPase subunit b [Geobacter metallireducens GS-15]ABB33622.1 ATP synthase F0, B subunit [Geobacter metallireducens GS-15]EHP84842.1 H+transporting two-sector ATPase B/B' subunit [Geobacter metallireducens RCH3]
MANACKKKRLLKSVMMPAAVCAAVIGLSALGFAAEGGEGAHHVDTGKQMKDFMWRVIDFAALLGVIIWALKKANAKGALADRTANIEKALREAEEARAAAEKKFAEYSGKLEKANLEIDDIYAAIRKEAELEKERIIAEAKLTADKIREQAAATASQEVLKAKAELRGEAARLAVQMAEQSLRENIKKDDQDRLVNDYLTKVENLH